MADQTSQVGIGGVGDLWVGSSGDDGQTIAVSAGGEILIDGGSPIAVAVAEGQIVGDIGNGAWAGGEILISGGKTGAVLVLTERNVTVFIGGIDRTEYVGIGIQRSVQVGSAGGTATFTMLNYTDSGLPNYRPSKFDEVIIYVGTYRWFCGFVNTFDEVAVTGTSGLYTLTVNCITFGGMLNFRYVGTHFELYNGTLLGIVMYALVSRYLSDLGITWGGQGSGWTQAVAIPPITFNWITFDAVCKQLAQMFNLDYYVDQWKVLRMFSHENGVNNSPFQILTNNGLWKQIKSTRGGGYANRVGVRNTQNLGSIWTDTAVGDGVQRLFIVSTELKQKPVVLVNGVAQRVTDAGVYTQPWDWYWLPFGIFQNFGNAVLTPSDTVEIKYPSVIDHVTWVENEDEIAAHGKFEWLEEVKDIITLDQEEIVAAGILARKVSDVTSIVIDTDEIGLEPGQVLTVNTARPPINAEFLIEQVDSTEAGKGGASPRTQGAVKGYFEHTVTASNTQLQRRTSGVALFKQILDSANQQRDRITYKIAFTLAETIPGITNPGLAVGIPSGAVRQAEKDGIARDCALYFNSSQTTLTTVRCVIDMKQNGVSIFPAGLPAKMVWPVGATVPQDVFIFKTDPLSIKEGDIFTLEILEADPLAMDGTIELTVYG